MKPMDIKKFHSLCIYHAQRIFDSIQKMPLSCYGLKPDGNVIVLTRHFESDKDKQWVYNMYAMILRAEKVTIYCFMSETWFYKQKMEKDEKFDINKQLRASEHPDKKSGLLIISTDKENNQISNFFEIEENNNGRLLLDTDFGEQVEDYVRLFDRLPENIADEKILLDTLVGLNRPDWYNTIKKDSFTEMKVDA